MLLISIAIECFIEGIGFGLTLQEEPGTALSLFVALLVGLIFKCIIESPINRSAFFGPSVR